MTSLNLGRNLPLLLAIFAGGLIILGLTKLYPSSSSLSSLSSFSSLTLLDQPRSETEEANILDGCHHVYLDMGSNM